MLSHKTKFKHPQSSFDFPALGQKEWSLQTPTERLETVAKDMKVIVGKKKENYIHENAQIELLREEYKDLSLISHYVNSSDEKSLNSILSLVKYRKDGTFVNHVNSKDGSTALLELFRNQLFYL